MTELARVEPPPYVPSRLRQAPDEAAARFQAAMRQYERRDYRAAIAGLQAAAKLDPEAPYVVFFLGVSHLLAGDADAAVRTLRRTVALGESAYLEEAHFYLAKAHLQKGDVDMARQELRATVQLHGDREREAGDLLRRLEQIQKR